MIFFCRFFSKIRRKENSSFRFNSEDFPEEFFFLIYFRKIPKKKFVTAYSRKFAHKKHFYSFSAQFFRWKIKILPKYAENFDERSCSFVKYKPKN